MLETLICAAAIALSNVVAVAKPAAPGTLPAAALANDPRHPTIVHIVSRDRTLTVKAGEKGLLYSLTTKEGKVLIADATAQKFEQLQPELCRQVRQYIAVKADDAAVTATASRDAVLISADIRE